jgi:hypothetical protein
MYQHSLFSFVSEKVDLLFPKIAFKRCASQVLARYFPAHEARHTLEETLKLQPVLSRQHRDYSFGLNLVLRYME